MTAFLIWLVVGGLIGWLASIAKRTDTQQGVLLNIIVGATGAFLGSLAMGRGRVYAPDYSIAAFAASLSGAILLVALASLINRSKAR